MSPPSCLGEKARGLATSKSIAKRLPPHRARWRPGNGVSSTLRRIGDFGRVPAFVSLCLLKCGYPERFARQALGHNSNAVHHASSKHAEVTESSLDDWEKKWGKDSERSSLPKLVPVDFRLPLAAMILER